MENETVLSAYHESARIVFTYLNGYTCDAMELPGKGSHTSSKLNAGNDIASIQAVLSGDPLSVSPEDLSAVINVARKMIIIYCAGTCAKIYYENNLKIPDELELDITGQDLTIIEKIQKFLKQAVVDQPDDYASKAIVSVFRKLKDPDVWKAIELLAAKVLQQGGSLKKFYVEDTLMQAGIKAQKATAKSGFAVGVHEDDNMKPVEEKKINAFDTPGFTPLDVMVRDFLKKIKNDWKEDQLIAATDYLNNIYKKYG